VTSDEKSSDNLRFLLGHPVRYLRLLPAPIRLLSVGMFINFAGAYVTALSRPDPSRAACFHHRDRHCPDHGRSVRDTRVVARRLSRPRLGCRLTIIVSTVGSALFTVLFIFRFPFPLTVGVVCLVAMFNRAFTPACATLVGRLSPPDKRVQRYAILQLSVNLGISNRPADRHVPADPVDRRAAADQRRHEPVFRAGRAAPAKRGADACGRPAIAGRAGSAAQATRRPQLLDLLPRRALPVHGVRAADRRTAANRQGSPLQP
jgi:hypothetical protein